MSPWKSLLQSYVEKYGGDKILYFKNGVWKVYLTRYIHFGEIYIS
jgi:hypothetical protein